MDKVQSRYAMINHQEDQVNTIQVKTVNLMTYNIWYDKFNQHNRFKAIRQIFSEYSPDFICLQECTPEMLQLLEDYPNYFVYSPPISSFDVAILSKHKAYKAYTMELPSELDRKLLCIELNLNGKLTIIGNVHFERNQSNYYRIEQLKKCLRHLNNYEHAYLLGDFNFDQTEEESYILDCFKDIWKIYKLEHNLTETAGVTRPKEKNKPVRYDRIYYKGDYKEISKFLLVGSEPIGYNPGEENKTGIITPSDHLGVYAQLELY